MARKATLRDENATRKKSRRRQRDSAADSSRQSEANQSALTNDCDELPKQFERLHHDLVELEKNHARGIAKLKESLGQRERDLDLLPLGLEQETRELERSNGALARLDQNQEGQLEAQESQCPTLRSRLDELSIALDSERDKHRLAEQEAWRLSVKRSNRIACLARQRAEMLVQVGQLRRQNDRLRDQQTQLREAAAADQHSLRETKKQLIQKSSEVEQLRVQFDTIQAQVAAIYSERSVAARKEIERLTTKAEEADCQLRECLQQLQAYSQSMTADQIDFAMSQRNRSISLLEQNTLRLQERLQREAAARRKAEGVIKRAIKNAGLDKALHDAWLEIHSQDQVERLKRQVKSLRNLNLLTHQKASAEISRYKEVAEGANLSRSDQLGTLFSSFLESVPGRIERLFRGGLHTAVHRIPTRCVNWVRGIKQA